MTKLSIPVALLGFGARERSALVAQFPGGSNRRPGYQQVLDIDDARYVIADGDQPGVADLLDTLGRSGDAIVVSSREPPRAALWVPRPADPVVVLGALDRLVLARDAPNEPARTPGAKAEPRLLDTARADAAAMRQRHEAALRPVTERHALLVDDSEVALAFLERRLKDCSITADRAVTSAAALRLLSQRSYGIVFLDVDLGDASDLDGLALCQAIKRRPADPGSAAPVVVLVSAFHNPSDRVRGRLAGADAYLGKPIDQAELDRLLRSHGLAQASGRRAPHGA